MAAPNIPPATILDLIHRSPEGTTVGNWTLTVKRERYQGRFKVWQVTVTGPGNREFTGSYIEQADGSPGRIVGLTDSTGTRWRATRSGSWFDCGG
jgi:hypothetical protein